MISRSSLENHFKANPKLFRKLMSRNTTRFRPCEPTGYLRVSRVTFYEKRRERDFERYSSRKFNNKIHSPISEFHWTNWTNWRCTSVSVSWRTRASIKSDRCGYCSDSIEIKTNVYSPSDIAQVFFTWFWSAFSGSLARTMNFDREISMGSLSIFKAIDWCARLAKQTFQFIFLFFFPPRFHRANHWKQPTKDWIPSFEALSKFIISLFLIFVN